MTRYLLDTNVISELRKTKPHGPVLQWIGELAEEQILLSAVALGELQLGIERTRLQDPEKAREIGDWADRLAQSYRVLPMDAACFREWGRLKRDKPDRILEDAMIAATARVHDLTVATRNGRDFARFEVPIFNPFTHSPKT